MDNPNLNIESQAGSTLASAHGSASDGKYITFSPLPPAPLTKRWAVMTKDQGTQLGAVSWYGPWRKYCFFPMVNTVYEQICLRDIAQFCETATKLHRGAKTNDPSSDTASK